MDPGSLRAGRLAFSLIEEGSSTIYVADFDRQKSYSVLADNQKFHDDPDWSQDGKRLIYSAGDDPTKRHIFLFDGDSFQQITDTKSHDEDPQWFSGAELISFIRVSGGRPRAIWTMQPDGTQAEIAYAAKAESFASRPSPKLTELLVVTDTDWPGRDILLIPFDNQKPRLVTIGSVNHDHPAWHPDGQRFAVTAGRSPETDIALIAVKRDGSNSQSPLEFVTREQGSERNAEWHDDGKRLFFIKDLANGGSEIRLLDIASKKQSSVILARSRINRLSWTPTAALNAPSGKYFVVKGK